MVNSINDIVNLIFIVFGWALFIWSLINLIRNKNVPEQSIRAVVADKQHFMQEIVQKKQPSYNKERFVIVFKALSGKRFLFDVSEITFVRYNIGDRGRLTYKGKKFIDFK